MVKEEALNFVSEIEDILEKNLKDNEKELIIKAYDLAKDAHEGQFRDSGEPFFSHPKSVAKILAELKMDYETIAAGLLHDVVEDCNVDINLINKEFGPSIARIVDGVTKISNLKLTEKLDKVDIKSLEKIETIRKMLLAMSKDIRVIIVKLIDRLHNMRTLEFVPYQKRVSKSQETLKIYAPIAHRLGMYRIKAELEDLSFKYLYPEAFKDLKKKVEKRLEKTKGNIDNYINIITRELKSHGIEAHVYGRTKHLYSIWEKMVRKGRSFDDIYDIVAVRIITNSPDGCYTALGVVHSIWKPIPGRIKDYIAVPKSNGYRSLHTTVITERGEPLEIQIRDWEMHQEAEFGLAAHWAYKEGIDPRKVDFIKRLSDIHKEIAISAFDISDVEKELETKEVFVFTPKGEVIHLPYGSTPIDFAYAIHTEIGNHFYGAKVNGRIVPISYILQNGDVIEIIVNKNFQGPSIDWLRYAKSSKTRNKIKKYYRLRFESQLEEKGREIIRNIAKKLSLSIENLVEKIKEETPIFENYNLNDEKDLYVKIGFGDIEEKVILKYFPKEEKKEETDEEILAQERLEKRLKKYAKKAVVLVDGQVGVDVRFAKCCSPIPGDDIIGIVSRRGITIHRKNCVNIKGVSEFRKVKVEWLSTEDISFTANVYMVIESRNVLNNIRKVVSQEGAQIEKYETEKDANLIKVKMRVRVRDIQHIARIINAIRNTKGVMEVRRS